MTSFAHQAAQIDLAALARYLEAELPGFKGPITAEKTPTGQSNPTFLLASPSGRYVLRKKPPGQLLKSAHAVDREYRVMKGAGGHRRAGAAHAAPVRGRQRDRHRVLRHGVRRRHRVLGPGAAGAGQRAAHQALRRAEPRARRPASVDPAKVGLADFGKAGSYFARQRDRWTKQYRASETEHLEDMETLIAWLEQNEPPDDGRVQPRARRLPHRQHDLQAGRLAPAGRDRLGALDHRPSVLRSRLPVHAVALSQPRDHARPRRRRPQRARHPDRGGIRRQILRAHGASPASRSGNSASPSPSSASPPSCRA